MDTRVDPVAAFGISLGDARVIRNVRLYPSSSHLHLHPNRI